MDAEGGRAILPSWILIQYLWNVTAPRFAYTPPENISYQKCRFDIILSDLSKVVAGWQPAWKAHLVLEKGGEKLIASMHTKINWSMYWNPWAQYIYVCLFITSNLVIFPPALQQLKILSYPDT